MDNQTILTNIKGVADRFARQRHERQQRRQLDPHDFDQLRTAGFLLTTVPVSYGGTWQGRKRSLRTLCEMLRVLAQADSSVALVASMHPAVMSSAGWYAERPPTLAMDADAWEAQRRWVFQTACEGHWWGTIVSEPGTGGDPARSRATARLVPAGGRYLISGQKHFGSGAGITSFMITTAVPEGETEPDLFWMDLRDANWDGSTGLKLWAAWDGHGMTATQSHALRFENFSATRIAKPTGVVGPLIQNIATPMWAAVVAGIVETAIDTARRQLAGRRTSLGAFEQVEWSRVEVEGWLIQQAYAGMLRDVEDESNPVVKTLHAKVAIGEMAETLLSRLCKVIGGSAYSRHTPYGFWLEDVRALGYLRPPWAITFDRIFAQAWDEPNPA